MSLTETLASIPDANSLWEQTSAAVLSLDAAGCIQSANPAAAALLGLPADGLAGRPLADFLDPFSQDKAHAMLAEAAAHGSAANWELDVLTPGAAPRLFSFSADRLTPAPPAPAGFVVVCSDLSSQLDLSARLAAANQQLEGALLELEKAHHNLQAAQAQLVQSEKMRSLGQLVAGVAHEINNPLAVVRNNSSYLAEALPRLEELARQAQVAALAPEQAAVLLRLLADFQEINAENQDGVQRIGAIVLALRSFSRLDEADFKLADLGEGLASTLKLAHTLCDHRIRLVTDLESLPPTYCHPGELNQVLMNLLVNAIQAIPGEGQVSIRARAAGGLIRIEIEDSGSGMPAEVLARLGEPFFTTKQVGSGTGLGLAISMGIVKRHQGRLYFASQPGQGTLATLEIPVRSEHAE